MEDDKMKKQNVKTAKRSKHKSQWALVWQRSRKNKLGMAGLVVITLLLVAVMASPLYLDYSKAITMNIPNAFRKPGDGSIFGTDQFGRDLFTRVMFGGRISLTAGLVTMGISFVVGVLLGGVAGYFGGKTDAIIMRLCDILMAVPQTLLSMAIVAALGPGLWKMLIALSIANIPREARSVRVCVMSMRNQEFVEAAKCYGTGNLRLIIEQIVPNILGPLVVGVMMGLGTTILSIAGLGFLGIGVSAPTPEWGTILSENQANIRYYQYLGVIPGLFIMISVLALNCVGDGLRDALDPKQKK